MSGFLKTTDQPTSYQPTNWYIRLVVGGRWSLVGILRKPISVACEFEYFTSYIYSVALIA